MQDLLVQLPAFLSIGDFTQWLSPDYLLERFGEALFWVGLAILFVECGLFFPFLPGDTLLFAVGLFLAESKIEVVSGSPLANLAVVATAFVAAAFAGNVVGYEIGRAIGPKLYERDGKIIKREYMDQTADFFAKHGSKALVIGRFVPFVRTYITVVAGVTKMDRRVFFVWSFVGAVIWVISLTVVGYTLGKAFPALGHYIDLVTYALLSVTVIVLVFEVWKKRREVAKQELESAADAAEIAAHRPDVETN